MRLNTYFMINKTLILGSLALGVLYGCASNTGTNVVRDFTSPQEVIVKKELNNANGRAREYVYYWGAKESKASEVESPKNYMSSYCQSRAGKFSLINSSKMPEIKDAAAKRRLNDNADVKQAIGTYRCTQKDGHSWLVSIEPVSESKRKNSDVRVVGLLTKLITEKEASPTRQVEKAPATKQPEKPVVVAKPTAKDEDVKVEVKATEEEKPKVTEQKETAQQLQQRLYMSSRRDLNAGKNQLAACNQLERAQNLGSFYNSSGPNVHTEASVLIAKCLITVPAYGKKFANPKSRAKTILEGIVKSQNHAVAKHMLSQIK